MVTFKLSVFAAGVALASARVDRRRSIGLDGMPSRGSNKQLFYSKELFQDDLKPGLFRLRSVAFWDKTLVLPITEEPISGTFEGIDIYRVVQPLNSTLYHILHVGSGDAVTVFYHDLDVDTSLEMDLQPADWHATDQQWELLLQR